MFGRVAAWASRHARLVLAASIVVALAAGVSALRLPTDAGTDTLVDSDSPAFQATEHTHRLFGDDPIVILARGDLQRLILTANLGRMLRLEACIAGNVPKGAKPLPGPCAELARLRPAKFVTGPGTFLNQAALGIDTQLAARIRAARTKAARVRLQQQLLRLAATYGLSGIPSVGDPRFAQAVVFDPDKPGWVPKPKLSYLFPNSRSAQIIVRLRPDLSDDERRHAEDLITAAVHDTTPRRACAVDGKPAPCFALDGGSYVVSGVPVVVDGLAAALKDALLVLFAIAVVVMAATLAVAFRSRLRMLPLGVALAAAGCTFGLLGLAGGSLTMASIAVLPVLIGLGVDYAVQLQARYDEALAAGAAPGEAARRAADRAGPMVGTACLATAAGFAVMLLSPTPMVRGFGMLMVVGVVLAFGLALTGGFAALSLAGGRPAPRSPSRLTELRERVAAAVARGGRGALAIAVAAPGRVLAIAFVLAACGWVAAIGIGTVSDIRRLVPPGLEQVRNLDTLQDSTGVSGELDVSVTAPDLTDPHVIAWIGAFKRRVLETNGFRGPDPSCPAAQICPGPAISDFFAGKRISRSRVRALLGALPSYELEQVVSLDRRGRIGHTALIAFGIRAQSLDDQQALIDRVSDQIGDPGTPQAPPPGVSVRLAGVPVLAARSASELSHSRYWLALAGLAAVALVLLAVYRSATRALVPLVPIVLATGWASLVVAATGIPFNPMSATLGVLVIAIATEFSVILAARFHEERGAGLDLPAALQRAYARTGAAVLVSGLTAIMGFAVLIASDIRMLRDFGVVTVIDLGVALLGVLLVLPAALVLAERRR